MKNTIESGLRQSRDGVYMARRLARGVWKAWHRLTGREMFTGTLRDLRTLGF